MPYTYIVQCADGTLYTGWTVDLEKRLAAHNEGLGAKYTSSRVPVSLVYWESQENQSTAQKREARIKKMSRCKKLDLIREFVNS
ncbi:GIY-YIG nuclease family protein [Pelosinus propionicus]|uniref:Putative endonuclease n=1 Tax=Pelosinus propionicus DSM 13327 TaxID=1123291 RepID=A0A1I4PCI1_9FIRM|nr:GIY-YIG nuclease family protein [Pelosinus propionicus]SFM25357.1 putative endonuclease [Pelosinus propionicus DSM 13327]